jgi:integrase
MDGDEQSATTLASVAPAYLVALEGTNRPSTIRRKRGILRILLRDLGDVPLAEIDAGLLDGYRIRRRNLVSGPSVNREMATLSHLYTWAQRIGLATFNPVTQVPRFPENTNAWQRLDYGQAERLIAAAGAGAKKAPHLQPLVLLALYTGLRKGELLGLNWGQVDLDRGTLEIVRQKNRVRSVLPLHERARDALLDWAVENEVTPRPCDFVFSHSDGRPFGEVRRSFGTALRRADLPKIRWHDLRHTFASWLVESGADLFTVQELMGHRDLAMTRRYAHLSMAHKRSAIAVLR